MTNETERQIKTEQAAVPSHTTRKLDELKLSLAKLREFAERQAATLKVILGRRKP
jgi:hypothetical protein